MLATLLSAALVGVEAHFVEIEIDVGPGLPGTHLVGLAASSVREGRVRIRAALQNSGFKLPPRKVTVNLAPADVKKDGSAFDLPVALGLLVAEGELPPEVISRWLFLGELALDGGLRPVRGVLPAAVLARRAGLVGIVVPEANGEEARVVEGIRVIAARRLLDAIAALGGELPDGAPTEESGPRLVLEPTSSTKAVEPVDLLDVRGQEQGKRALEVAAAGGHNLLLVGPPGSGKTMLARRLPTLLPPLSFDAALETTTVWSVAGLLTAGLCTEPPFRAPHHTVSDAGLVGGGVPARPGEVSLAHHGVLFLDELLEFRRGSLEALRQPLEDRRIGISRARQTVVFPASVMLVAAMNPCRCGHLGDPRRPCRCSLESIRSYRARLSGPLLDRIDLQVEVPVPPSAALHATDDHGAPHGESSATVRARVIAARERQHARQGADVANAQLSSAATRRHCALDPRGARLLELAVERLGFSARAHGRLLKVARTIADLAGCERIDSAHLAEAIGYRALDRDPATLARATHFSEQHQNGKTPTPGGVA